MDPLERAAALHFCYYHSVISCFQSNLLIDISLMTISVNIHSGKQILLILINLVPKLDVRDSLRLGPIFDGL